MPSLLPPNSPVITARFPPHYTRAYFNRPSYAWHSEVAEPAGPIAQLRRIASNPNPLRNTGHSVVQNEEHEPSRRADMRIRRCRHCTARATATDSREDGSLAHAVAVRARHRTHERDLDIGRRCCHLQGDGLAVTPVGVVIADYERRLWDPREEVRRDEDFVAIFLHEPYIFRVRAGHQYSSIEKQNRLGMV